MQYIWSITVCSRTLEHQIQEKCSLRTHTLKLQLIDIFSTFLNIYTPTKIHFENSSHFFICLKTWKKMSSFYCILFTIWIQSCWLENCDDPAFKCSIYTHIWLSWTHIWMTDKLCLDLTVYHLFGIAVLAGCDVITARLEGLPTSKMDTKAGQTLLWVVGKTRP